MKTWLVASVACPLICAALLITAALNAPERPVFVTDAPACLIPIPAEGTPEADTFDAADWQCP